MAGLSADIVAPLFVPGDRPERFAKAQNSGADAVIIDLEDAVAPEAKATARAAAIRAGKELKGPIILRVNAPATPWFEDDIDAALRLPMATVMLPKAENPQDLAALDRRLGGTRQIVVLIETAAGLANLPSLLAIPNIVLAAFGSVDFALDLGCDHERAALLAVRSELCWRSRAARKLSPWDGVTLRFDDAAQVADDARYSASLGFGGKLAIHPRQIEPISRGFRPSPELMAWAAKILASAGTGAASKVGGEMVDAPILQRARNVMRVGERSNATKTSD